jgi:hypothetical protein
MESPSGANTIRGLTSPARREPASRDTSVSGFCDAVFPKSSQENKIPTVCSAKFLLWNVIHAADSSYVCRVRDNSVYEVIEEKLLTDADRKAGVISDQIVKFTGTKADNAPDHTVRLVTVSASEHTSRGNRATGSSTGPSCDGKLRLATDLLDIPAELIAEAYRLRWLIELFFRMFKQLLGCRHLLSTKQNGVEIQTYLAIIACLLILIYTGRAPTKRTFEMICLYMSGWASLEELERHIEKLRPAKK